MEKKKAIALIYGALMMSHQCLLDSRPRADYSRFYRENYRKLLTLKYKNNIIESLKSFYKKTSKCIKENQRDYANSIIRILENDYKITKKTS